MIRELINFMNDLMSDIPDIMGWKCQPDKGLHVFIDIDSNGVWINKDLKKGRDYDYFDGKNKNIPLWNNCIRYQEATTYITMNKVKRFDTKKKIHSCSPFAIAYNFNFSDKDKQSHGIKIFKKTDKTNNDKRKENNQLIRKKRFEVVSDRLKDYYDNCIHVYNLNMLETNDSQTYKYKAEIEGFFSSFKEIISCLKRLKAYKQLSEKDYLHLYLRSVPVEEIEKKHKEYIEQEIFNGEVLSDKKYGVVGFFTAYNDKKPFLKHQTCYLKNGISQRFSINDAMALFYLDKLLRRKSKCLPNPLPIVVDQREINTAIVKIFNDKKEPLSYRQLLESLFTSTNKRYLSDYYLLNYSNTTSGMVLNDFDFVPMFRYELSQPVTVSNVTMSGFVKDKVFNKDPDINIKTIFDFERIVVKMIFNNTLVKIKDDDYTCSYFGDLPKPEYVQGGSLMVDLILKYRQAVYAYIYKSDLKAITHNMFDDMMFNSILTNIRSETIKNRCEWNNNIKGKINLWFSLQGMFNRLDNKKMEKNVTELREIIRDVANGKATLNSSEELAFAAGQLVSFIIDQSEAKNKTYAMLEPYLQKSTSSQLQDEIAQSIAIYKHAIKVKYKREGNFERLASETLAYGNEVKMRPLLKFFLAGCFSPCVIYETNNNTTNK